MEGILEADRALAVGAMEYVPEEQMERVLAESTVHPWTMAQQGANRRRSVRRRGHTFVHRTKRELSCFV